MMYNIWLYLLTSHQLHIVWVKDQILNLNNLHSDLKLFCCCSRHCLQLSKTSPWNLPIPTTASCNKLNTYTMHLAKFSVQCRCSTYSETIPAYIIFQKLIRMLIAILHPFHHPCPRSSKTLEYTLLNFTCA